MFSFINALLNFNII